MRFTISLVATKFFTTSEHPSEGTVRYVRPAVRFTASPARVRLPAPRLGQDTAGVMAGLGYSDAEVAELEAAGVIIRAPATGKP